MERRFRSLLLLLLPPLLNLLSLNPVAGIGGGAAGVIKVNYKFAGSDASLSALRAHDDIRHLSILAGVDLPLGGTGRPDAAGCALYSTLLLLNFLISLSVFAVELRMRWCYLNLVMIGGFLHPFL